MVPPLDYDAYYSDIPEPKSLRLPPEQSTLPILVGARGRPHDDIHGDHRSEDRIKYGSSALAVAPGVYHIGLEVLHGPESPQVQGWPSRAASTEPLEESVEAKQQPVQPAKPSRRRRWIWIGVVALLLVIIGAVVGGVVGSQAAKKGDKAENHENSPSPTNEPNDNTPVPSPTEATDVPTLTESPPAPAATSIVSSKSSIAVTGWQPSDTSHNIIVAFQNPEGSLVYSQFNNGEYSRPQPLSPQYEIKGTPAIASSALPMFGGLWDGIQLELFYLNSSSVFNGVNYNTGEHAKAKGFQPDSINNVRFSSIDGGDMSAYWPLILFQDISLNLQFIRSYGLGWETVDINIRAKDRSRLALVPVSTKQSTIKELGWIAIMYQDDKGTLLARANPVKTVGEDVKDLAAVTKLWEPDNFPNITLEDGASFTAFSVGRPDVSKSTDRVNTYILYQDASLDIKQALLDDDEGWKMSSPKALQKADKGTDIACITAPTWEKTENVEEYNLGPPSSLNRCYFQKNGEIVEVVLDDGGDWKDPSPLFKDSAKM